MTVEDEIESAIEEQVSDEHIIETYAADEGKLRRALELEEFRAEVTHLTTPDTGEPFDHPWHVLIVGPDPTGDHGKLWSMSYDAESGAVEAAKEQLKKKKRRYDRRRSKGHVQTALPDGGQFDDIDAAIRSRVNPQDVEMGGEQVGNTRFRAKDGVGGMARLTHESMPIAVDVSPRGAKLFSRVDGYEIEVDHSPRDRPAWRGGDETFGRSVRQQSAMGWDRASASDLRDGDHVRVHLNGRASKQLGTRSFEATVVDVAGSSGGMPAGVTFEPVDGPLGTNQPDTHTWYPDIGYIHGHHDGLGRNSDIGRVQYVERESGMGPEHAQDAGGGGMNTVRDVPNEGYTLITGNHERDAVLEHIGEDPDDWSHGGLFVRTDAGDYTDVIFFPGNVPYLDKSVTRIL